MVGDNALVVIDQFHIIPRVAMGMPSRANKYYIYIYNRPRTASPAAMTTIIDEAPIDLRCIYADRDMKIMQANQRSSYINTAVCCIVIDLRPDAKSAKTLLANITSLATDCCR